MNDAQITVSIIGFSYWILIIYWLLEARFNPLSSYETFIVSEYRVKRYNLHQKVFYYFKLTCLIIAPVFTSSVISYYNLKFFYSFGANPDQILTISLMLGIAVALIIGPLFLRSVKQPVNSSLHKLSKLLYKDIHEVFWDKSNASERLSKTKDRYQGMLEKHHLFIEHFPEFSEDVYKSDVDILLKEAIQYIENLKSFATIDKVKDLEAENCLLNEKLEKTEKKLKIQKQEVKRNTELADLYKQRGAFSQIKTFSQIPSDGIAYVDEGIIQSECKPYIPFIESAKHRNPNLYNCVEDLKAAILPDFNKIDSGNTFVVDQSIRSVLQLIQYLRWS